MRNSIINCRAVVAAVFGAVFAFAYLGPAIAGMPGENRHQASSIDGGGIVLPPLAEPMGYSLARMARYFAPFNVTDHSGTPPASPFQVLFTSAANPTNTFQVRPGTMLYVPVIYNDNSPPILGDFPDVTNRQALLQYFYSQQEFGAVYAIITVDGTDTSLGPDYLVGLSFPSGLADGATGYMTVGAFLTPLKKGTHTVAISGSFTGAALTPYFGPGGYQFSLAYTVVVH